MSYGGVCGSYGIRTVKAPKSAIVAILIAGPYFSAVPAEAGRYDGLAAVADYPAKLVRFVDRADGLIDKANDMAACRLDQAQRLVDAAIDGQKSVENKVFKDLLSLETKTMADLRQLVSQGK